MDIKTKFGEYIKDLDEYTLQEVQEAVKAEMTERNNKRLEAQKKVEEEERQELHRLLKRVKNIL